MKTINLAKPLSIHSRLALTWALLFAAALVCPRACANEEIYRKIAPATALIYKSEGPLPSGAGTGFLIDAKERLLITARHVVEKANGGVVPAVIVMFAQIKDGEVITEADYYRKNRQTLAVRGTVVYESVSRDMAVVQLDHLPEGIKPLELSSQRARPGQTVHLIGNSTEHEGGVFGYCQGHVRNSFPWESMGARVVATQAPSNKGDSGGPMVNNLGEVVGFAFMIINKAATAPQLNQNADLIQLLQLSICVTEIRAGLEEMRRPQKQSVAFSGEAKSGFHSVLMEKDAIYRINIQAEGFIPDVHIDNILVNVPASAPLGQIQQWQHLYTPTESRVHRIQVGHMPGRDIAQKSFPYKLAVDRVNFEPQTAVKDSQLPLTEHARKLEAGKIYSITVRGKGFEPDLQIIDQTKTMATKFATGQPVKAGLLEVIGLAQKEYETTLSWLPPRTAEYRILVAVGPYSNVGAGPLDYTLQIRELKIAFSVSGQLTAKDPLYSKAGPHKSHSVKLEADKNYQIELSTTAFDSRLVLEDSGGKIVAQGFDADGFNARLFFRPTTSDNYKIIATTHQIDAAGAYTITVAENLNAQPGPQRAPLKTPEAEKSSDGEK